MSIDEQKEYIKDDISKLSELKSKLSQILKLFPYELKTIEQVQGKLKTFHTNFYDISFPPDDPSTFE
jgi:hypothetical protein